MEFLGKTIVALSCVICAHVLIPSHAWIASLIFVAVAFRWWSQGDPDKVFLVSIGAAVLAGVIMLVSVSTSGGGLLALNETGRSTTSSVARTSSHRAPIVPDLPEDPILGGSARVQVIRPQIELQSETFHLCDGDNKTAELTFILRADPEEQVFTQECYCSIFFCLFQNIWFIGLCRMDYRLL
jgi:hypothetical protein